MIAGSFTTINNAHFSLKFVMKQQAEQLKKMKQEEIAFHENEIKKLKDSVAAHEKRMENLQSKQH